MTEPIQEITGRIQAKIGIVAERQALLVGRIKAERDETARLRAKVDELAAEVRRLKADNEYLSVMRAVAPTPKQAEQSRALLAELVREIDKCIAELTA